MGIKIKAKVVPTISFQIIVKTLGDNHYAQTKRLKPLKIKASTTIENILKTLDIDYHAAYTYLNGAVLHQSDLRKSLSDLTYIDSNIKYILTVVKDISEDCCGKCKETALNKANQTDILTDAAFRQYIYLMKADKDNSRGFVYLSNNYEKFTKKQLAIIIRAFDIAIHPQFSANRDKVIKDVSVERFFQFIAECIESQVSNGWPEK